MTDFIASGRLIELVLVLMAVEAVVLWLLHRRTGRGVAPTEVVIMLAAGASLMLAVHAALVGAAAHWIAVCLTGSLVAHLADLGRRWRSGSALPSGPRNRTVAFAPPVRDK